MKSDTTRLKLIYFMKKHDMTVSEISTLLGVNTRTVERWRAGTQKMSRQSKRAFVMLRKWREGGQDESNRAKREA
jgi:DNA-binding transcriptional regulator YiaG